MISISYSYSSGYKRYFESYPQRYNQFKERAKEKVLLFWIATAKKKAYEKHGKVTWEMGRGITADIRSGRFMAGTNLSYRYALIQDVGGRAGRGGSVLIKPKHYFFKMAEDSEAKVMKIYEEELEKVING